MNSKAKDIAVREAAGLFGCSRKDLAHMTLREIFNDCERYGEARIGWGCWTDEELDERPKLVR